MIRGSLYCLSVIWQHSGFFLFLAFCGGKSEPIRFLWGRFLPPGYSNKQEKAQTIIIHESVDLGWQWNWPIIFAYEANRVILILIRVILKALKYPRRPRNHTHSKGVSEITHLLTFTGSRFATDTYKYPVCIAGALRTTAWWWVLVQDSPQRLNHKRH